MSATPRPSSLRRKSAGLAVAGVAGLASVFAMFPAALADDSVPPDTTGPAETAAPDPTPEPSPSVETPTPTDETPDPPAPATVPPVVADPGAAPDTSSPVPAKAVVAPDYGDQKFRVGVKLADGSVVPEGTTTANTTITITISGGDLSDPETTTCQTDPETLNTDDNATATYCLGDLFDSEEPSDRAAAARVEVDPDDDSSDFGLAFELRAGQTATLRQTSTIPGFDPSTDVVTIAPCTIDTPGDQVCSGRGFFGNVKLTKVLFVNTPPAPAAVTPPASVDRDSNDSDDDDDDKKDSDSDNASLPDTGGPDAMLLGLGVLLAGSGAAATVAARRGSRRADALAD